MVVDYCICWYGTSKELADYVYGMLKKGWQPQGGVGVAHHVKRADVWSTESMAQAPFDGYTAFTEEIETVFYQAMVKYGDTLPT